MTKPAILTPRPEDALPPAKKVAAVHPFGSKILVEVMRADELIGSKLYVSNKTEVEGAPQAYIIEVGPQLEASTGLKVGQRVYWTGRGTEVKDPRTTHGRVRALLEVSNILAIIDEAE